MKVEHSTTAGRWMLVDDDDGLRGVIGDLIAATAGVEVYSFASPVAALSEFATAPDAFDFIVTDLDMPKLSGIDLARRIKAIRPDIKILLATGSGVITAAEAIGMGFCGMISKPFAGEALCRALMGAHLGAEEMRRTRLPALLQRNHQPTQAGSVPVCMTA